MNDIKSILNNHLPIVDKNLGQSKKLPILAVDKVADELVDEYKNIKYRRWYCGVIYEFGFEKVEEWRCRAREGNEPAKLFSKYVKDSRAFRSSLRLSND